ncbi:DNA methyltransferase [Paenibacillus sp. RC67]|uniref:DNA methyltransferase n=1 Tax=Paenibacillus sp. RC67 TaxID=3039392 RepID=UPI0024AE2C6D|nr:DNA methyltransferase [Paenibacillus sp. RC67]
MSDKLKQGTLFEINKETQTGPVTCLGLTFENDEARRAYFTEELRKKLPELKKIEGFPEGEDEDILALSDPPYYTVCPNPWIIDFIAEWNREKKSFDDANIESYNREPFTADVSEGKTDSIYKAHGYHTKVPHKAIMRYILHYTNPGDIVWDGFAGTGMTGVAGQLCNDETELRQMGFTIEGNDVINQDGEKISERGIRKTILSDLSPAATFISSNFNLPIDKDSLSQEIKKIMGELKKSSKWMYEVNDPKYQNQEKCFTQYGATFLFALHVLGK